jgi:hypothetical protein
MSTSPLLLVSKSVRALLPYWREPLGQLFTPRMLSGLDITEACRIQWAADNDCFAGFDQGRYLDMLEALTYRPGCLFITCPDVVADARATLRLFDQWRPALQTVWATVDEDDVDPGQPVHQPIGVCRPGRPGAAAGAVGLLRGHVCRRLDRMEARPACDCPDP